MAETDVRPNIRIEISNNLVESESMEVDDEDKKSLGREEGEIWEDSSSTPQTEPQIVPKLGNRIWSNVDGGFSTGINIFDKDEQIKLQERAKRFALPPEEINTFTDENLQELHASLGITKENDKNVRFEAIHMRGTDEMSTEDVLDYFAKYGPFGIEWIDDSCCNVIWVDDVSTARALHYISKPINNLPVRGPCDPFLRDFESETEKQDDGKSVLLRNREVELTDDDNEIIANKESKFEDGVDVAEISAPVPPGFWRLGKPHAKSKNILLRFAYRTDKKPYKAEKFSEYYRKYGNPNYGGLKGIITEGKKQQFKGIFDRNRAIQGPGNNEDGSSKNPWGGLAENWDNDADLREKEYDHPLAIPDNKPELKNSGLLDRLGFKRAHDPENDEEEPEKARKKVKIPRMKMYADEEEQKIKRKKQLMAVKGNKETQKDLRSILGITGVRKRLDPEDLGAKLKNRIRNTQQTAMVREEKITRSIVNDRIGQREKPRKSYERRLHSDREEKPRRRRRSYQEEEESEDENVKHKPRSKVAVVIKTQKQPTVASTVWSRIREKGRFKTAPESIAKKQTSSESSEASSSSNSSESSSESEDSDDVVEKPEIKSKVLNRPGFTNNVKSSVISKISDHKSPLRIEISNEHFRRK